MATNISTRATVNLSVNGKDAVKTLDQLRKKSEDLKRLISEVEAGNSPDKQKRLTNLRQRWQEVEKQIRQCTTEIGRANEVLRRLDTASTKELKDTLRILNSELNSMQRGTAGWDKQVRKIQAVEAELRRVNASMRTQQGLLDRINGVWAKIQTVAVAAAAAATGLIAAGRKAVSMFMEMDETMANTSKFTGLSTKGTKELNEAFKAIDTRVARAQLNELAQEAGRLGKNTKESVKDYVEAAQIINVALDDLGEGATQDIAKLTNIFGVEQQLGTRRAMLATASAVNVLSQNCTASKPYLVEFSKRMAGIGAQAGLSIPEIVAFGAVLDANGQKCEMSATAIQKIIMALANQNQEFSKLLGLDAAELKKTLQGSAKDGIIMYLEAIKKLSDQTSAQNATMAIAPLFKDMGMDAARVAAVLSTLANHLGEVKDQINNANEAFEKATSATNEFNIFNNTATAQVDKAKKAMQEYAITLGEKLYPVMSHIYTSGSIFLKVLSSLVTFLMSNWKAIVSLTAAIAAYQLTISAATIKTKMFAAATSVSSTAAGAARAAVLLLQAAFALVTGNITRASAAMRMFSAVTKANPIGLLVSFLTAAATAIALATSKTDEFKKSADKAMKSAESFAEETAKEKKELDRLFGVLDAAEKSTKEYAEAKKQIISGYGMYLRGLIDEKGEIKDLALAYDRLTFAAQKSARERGIRSAKSKLDETYYSEIDNLTEELRESLVKIGVGDRNVSSVITTISQAIGAGKKMPGHAVSQIMGWEAGKTGFWTELFGSKPSDIIDKIIKRQDDYNKRSQKLDSMSQRTFAGLENDRLSDNIKSLEAALSQSPMKEVDVTLSLDDKSRQAIESIVGPKSNWNGKVITSKEDFDKAMQSDGNNFFGNPLPFPYVKDAASATLQRSQAENLLRELLFEANSRGLKLDKTTSTDTEFGSEDFSYKSEKDAEKEAKAAAIKARKEFKEGLEAIKAAYEKTDAEIKAAYAAGTIEYLDYLNQRNKNESDYCDKAREYFKKNLSTVKDIDIEADKDYQAFLERKTNAEATYNKKVYDFKAAEIKRRSEAEINEAKAKSDMIAERTLTDEIALQHKVSTIKADAIREQMNLLTIGSEEWIKLKQQLEIEEDNSRIKAEAMYQNKVNELRKEYDKKSAAERYEMELNVLKILLDESKIKLEEFEKWKLELQKKYRQEVPGGNFDRTQAEKRDESEKMLQKQIKEIEEAREKGLISQEEANRRIAQLKKESIDPILEKMKQSDDWVKLTVDLADAWAKLWESIANGGNNTLDKISKASQATFAVVVEGMRIASEFSKASAEKEIAAITKRYEREKELAQGNKYLTERIEKEKQKKIADIKNKAEEKAFAMQVIQAIGQTIQGAINAYTSTAAIPVVGPALAPFAAAVAAAAGATNVALLVEQQKASKAKGYAEGGYTKPGARNEVAGIVHAGEWVASQSLVNSPVTAPVIAMLEQVQRSNRIGSLSSPKRGSGGETEFENGGYVVAHVGRTSGFSPEQSRQLQRLTEVVDRLAARLDEPFVTVNSVTGQNGIKRAMDEYNTIIRNRKRAR